MRYLLTLGLLFWAGSASAFTINGKTYSTWNGKTLATWNGVTAAAPSNALVPSNSTFESGLSPWTDVSSNSGGGASSSASVISTAEMMGSSALQLAGVGGSDYDSNAESGGNTDGTASVKYTFPVSAIDSAHKLLTFDLRPKDLHVGGDYDVVAYSAVVFVNAYNGVTNISKQAWADCGLSVFDYPAGTTLQGGSFPIPAPAVDTTYTVQLDILSRAQSSLLAGHTWGEVTSVTVVISVFANGAASDGAGTVTNPSRCTVLIDNFR